MYLRRIYATTNSEENAKPSSSNTITAVRSSDYRLAAAAINHGAGIIFAHLNLSIQTESPLCVSLLGSAVRSYHKPPTAAATIAKTINHGRTHGET